MSMEKNYNPQKSEEEIYKNWEQNGYFETKISKSKKPFTVVMPPPNITGNLHMGHAMDQTMQDIIVRFKRMQGYSTLWIPGTDHASIATEAKIVEQIKKEGLSKKDIGRNEFLKRAWAWKKNYGGNIVNQLKRLGVSCDWKKERFTMDEGCEKAVKEFFIRLYKRGLIYKGEKVINWCPKCLTSISDSEVDHVESEGSFWYIRYSVAGEEKYVEVATTRPETIFGDVALAVNPEDVRYKNLIGKEVIIPLVGRTIPIIGDKYVDASVGTGILKVTPAHDPNDFEIGLRHKLPIICVMDEKAYLNNQALEFSGIERDEARKLVAQKLKEEGYLSKVERIKHSVGMCYRCSTAVEPRVSKQWFVKMKDLAGCALREVREGKIKFIPERFSKIYFNWMENIKDWCISRQLWWGHRIPVWYCKNCGEIIVSEDDVKCCSKCLSKNLEQELDTLDTWFSSALWPFSTLGWPEKTEEFNRFFPADVLVTGYDLIFFWIAKMIFSSLAMTSQIPFKHILIHGLIRDFQGKKMSKSLGNGIDPIEIINKYGADALRFSLLLGNSPGNDLKFSEEKVESSRNFANKIWNAARFVQMRSVDLDDFKVVENSLVDKWIISRLNKVINEVTKSLEKLDLGLAAQKLYDFIWDEFCDWYIEFSKLSKSNKTLEFVIKSILKLIHPFMPFLTEKIWGYFDNSSIMISDYPIFDQCGIDEKAEQEVQVLIAVIKTIRNMRREMNVSQGSKKTSVYIEVTNSEFTEVLEQNKNIICRLSFAKDVEIKNSFDISKCKTSINEYSKIYIPIAELIDKNLELEKLEKQLKSVREQLEKAQNRLLDKNFISKAPKQVIEGAKDVESKLKNKVKNLELSILEIKSL